MKLEVFTKESQSTPSKAYFKNKVKIALREVTESILEPKAIEELDGYHSEEFKFC